MDLRRALVVSCDTIYYRFAHEMWLKDRPAAAKEAEQGAGTEKKVGKEKKVEGPADPMQHMARAFGFGARRAAWTCRARPRVGCRTARGSGTTVSWSR